MSFTLSFTLSMTCGNAGAAPERRPRPFTLTSRDFEECGPLPRRSALDQLGCRGQNIAPTLHWTGVPPGTASFALTVTDYDAPVAGGFHHWIVFNIPAHVDTLNGASLFPQGTNSFGLVGYSGPCPPATGQAHHYIFRLYALTVPAIPGKDLTYDQLLQEISSNINGATVTIGTFVRR